jgi:anti-sigma regulatory factor (Ser/Thr protein kinase)
MDEWAIRFIPDTRELGRLRAHLRAFCAFHNIEGLAREEALLVASELCSNAVAAARGRFSMLWLAVGLDGTDIVIEVSDDGPGFSMSQDIRPDRQAVRGRGLVIVRALCERLTVRSERGRTLVTARLAMTRSNECAAGQEATRTFMRGCDDERRQ